KLSGDRAGGQVFSAARYSLRAFLVENAQVASSSLGALEARFVDARLSVHRVQRGDDLLKPSPALVLQHGDRLVVSARREAFRHAERDIGPEINDPALLSVPVMTV